MHVINQTLEDILDSLRPITVDWQDETATRVIEKLRAFPEKATYTAADVEALLDENFVDGILICRLFLGVSDDGFESMMREARGDGAGIGVKAYQADKAGFIKDVSSTGLLQAMADGVSRKLHWTDILVERLRSGRGSAVVGQRPAEVFAGND
jgi:hypothetical protein